MSSWSGGEIKVKKYVSAAGVGHKVEGVIKTDQYLDIMKQSIYYVENQEKLLGCKRDYYIYMHH